MNDRWIAIHESSHAVVGLCLGRRGLLKKVSIVEASEMKGGCHWNVSRGKCPPVERDQEIAIGCAGPIGQVLFAPESLGLYAEDFARTIFQPDDVLEKAGCSGWASTDLNLYIAVRREQWPTTEFEEIEKLMKPLLLRSSVSLAIGELATCLEVRKELDGVKAECLVDKHLRAEDYVGKEYLQ